MSILICGVDEVGRGPLMGPVVAAAVIIPEEEKDFIHGIKDSKKLSAAKRVELFKQITERYEYAVGIVDHEEIDRINILEATKKACSLSIEKLKTPPEYIYIDGNMSFPNLRYKYESVIGGDAKIIQVAAASIIAKVTRDNIVLETAKEYPEYNWHKNFGYGTKEHIEAIKKYGLSPYHRRSFKVSSIKDIYSS